MQDICSFLIAATWTASVESRFNSREIWYASGKNGPGILVILEFLQKLGCLTDWRQLRSY